MNPERYFRIRRKDQGNAIMKIGKFSASGLLRGVSAAAFAGAVVLGLGSGTASALVIDFDPAPFPGFLTSFATDGFTFTFAGDGDFVASPLGGEPGGTETRSIQADSIPVDAGIEIITIVLTGGGPFTFDSIYIDSVAGGATTVAGFDSGGQIYSTLVAAVFTGVVNSNSLADVLKVELRSADFFSLRFDSFTVNSEVGAVPEPGTLALFVAGLFGLGLLSRRRRRSA